MYIGFHVTGSQAVPSARTDGQAWQSYVASCNLAKSA